MFKLLLQYFDEQEIAYLRSCFNEEEWEAILTSPESFLSSCNGPRSTFDINIDLFKSYIAVRDQYDLESIGSKRFLISKEVKRISEHQACLESLALDETLYNPVIIEPDPDDPCILVIDY